jgi:hypothetical protein
MTVEQPCCSLTDHQGAHKDPEMAEGGDFLAVSLSAAKKQVDEWKSQLFGGKLFAGRK